MTAKTDDPSDATTDEAAAGEGETPAGSESAAAGTAPADAGDGTATEEPQISHDDCFDLLSNHRRRYALHHLQRNGDGATLGELADRVAAWENDVEADDVTRDQRKRVYTSLQQVHLPRMDEMGVVEFDDEGIVRPGPAAEDLDIYLEIVGKNDVPWSTLYLALALLSAGLVGAATLGVPPLASVPAIGWMMFVLMTFLVTSVTHQYLAHTRMLLGRAEEPPGKHP